MLPTEDLHNSLVVVVAKLTEERHQRNPYGNKVSNKIKPLQQQITEVTQSDHSKFGKHQTLTLCLNNRRFSV
jgi:hypothetical protein